MQTIKKAVIYVSAIFATFLGIFLIFRSSDKKKEELLVADAKLEGKQEEVKKEIEKDENALEDLKKDGVVEMTPDEVIKYWEKELKK